ncbi:MAG: hypothetical protein WDZ35_11750 [Crocinitomicaceae bacterium]
MQKPPTWGKAIGIIIICLGALGFFYNIYKLIIPTFLNFQSEFMGEMSNLEHNELQRAPFDTFQEMISITPWQSQVIVGSGILGIILCGFYLAGGIKLQKANYKNFIFAKNALIAFIILNALTLILVFFDNFNFIVFGLMVYLLIGLIFDIVLLIIMLSSDRSIYERKASDLDSYTVNRDSDEII